MRARDDNGKFTSKSDTQRDVRSLRATDQVWDEFGDLASSKGMSRADLLEVLVQSYGRRTATVIDDDVIHKIVDVLQDALDLKPNAGGAIKAKVREALQLLRLKP
jgi:hypothetical protein